MKRLFLAPAFIVMPFLLSAQNPAKPTVASILQKMSLEDKVNLVVGMGMSLPGADMANGPVVGQTMDKVPGAAGTTCAYPAWAIPNTVLADGPAGLRILPTRTTDKRTYYATAFPVGTLLASTWDTKLVESVGKAMGNEVKEYGVDVLLAPALNIHRNPLGGRNFEYYSEDPVVAGNIAAAMVNGIESNGVGTSIKHFAANNQETNRNLVNTIASERTLREIYLRPFEITVKKSQPWTVMSSYNKINGVYTSESKDLLTTILRKEWGFKGLVMTDWFGGKDAVAQMKAGNDLLMPGTPAQTKALLEAVKTGALDMKVLDENATRILNYILGSPAYQKYAFSNKPDLAAHAKVARMAATEGMVLLKNESTTLPFSKDVKNIAAFGNTSYDFISGGTGSGDVNEAYTISLVEGLSNAGYKIDDALKAAYETHIEKEKSNQPPKKFFFELPPPIAELQLDANLLEQKAATADVAIFTVGRNAGEFQDRKVENDYYLSDMEKKQINDIAQAFHAKGKKLIVILNVGGVMDVSAWRMDADAILLAWQPGQEAGNAVADILSGKANPSGKLATTFPMAYTDVPSAKSFPGRNLSTEPVKGIGGLTLGFDSEVSYDEGIYTGYRYYNSFHVKPAYEFGYGLSYTKFTYGKISLSSAKFNKQLTVSLTVTNTGKTAGKEIVQLYLTAPAASYDKPAEELKGFAKTGLLKPGESQKIVFTLDPKDLASYDNGSSAWVADAGNYIVKVGASSEDSRQTASFSLQQKMVVEKCNKVLLPPAGFTDLKK